MRKKDIEQIKFDLGLCTDILMALFIGLFINKIIGIIYFCLSLVIELVIYVKEQIHEKYFKEEL